MEEYGGGHEMATGAQGSAGDQDASNVPLRPEVSRCTTRRCHCPKVIGVREILPQLPPVLLGDHRVGRLHVVQGVEAQVQRLALALQVFRRDVARAERQPQLQRVGRLRVAAVDRGVQELEPVADATRHFLDVQIHLERDVAGDVVELPDPVVGLSSVVAEPLVYASATGSVASSFVATACRKKSREGQYRRYDRGVGERLLLRPRSSPHRRPRRRLGRRLAIELSLRKAEFGRETLILNLTLTLVLERLIPAFVRDGPAARISAVE